MVRIGVGEGGWPKSRPPRARPCAPTYEREVFWARGAQGLFFGRLFWHRNGGSVYTGFWRDGFDATPGLARVVRVLFEYGCNPAAPPSGPGSLAGCDTVSRVAQPVLFQSHCFSPPPPFAHSATPKTTLAPSVWPLGAHCEECKKWGETDIVKIMVRRQFLQRGCKQPIRRDHGI